MFCPYSLVSEKNSSLSEKLREICARTFVETPPQYSEQIVQVHPPHKIRTISAHFRMPPHIFRTNFLEPVGNAPRTSFAQFSRAHGLFSKSASLQAMNVSTLVNAGDSGKWIQCWVCQTSPDFAGLRQTSHEGAGMLPVPP